jgi:diguanylate cyclase (GGDEF)-like protein
METMADKNNDENGKGRLRRAVDSVLNELPREELVWLLHPRRHMMLLAAQRAHMILSRVRLVAALFAVLTPLWIVVDIAVFAWPTWGYLASGRLAVSVAFALLAMRMPEEGSMRRAYLSLAALFLIPTLFFLFSYDLVAGINQGGFTSAVSMGYTFLPFVMLAGLSVFPLTALESLAYATPVLLGELVAAVPLCACVEQSILLGTFWLLALIAIVATLSGMSQLAFMIALVRRAIRDGLTGAFTRASGQELLDIQFTLSTRNDTPMALAFIDLDRFKQVNDRFGHDAGDAVLRNAAANLMGHLRTGDMLVRWGGEEFLLIMPNSTQDSAHTALDRVMELGLGEHPDGGRVTASVGIAERMVEGTADWMDLIEAADRRMYLAKQQGRNRIVAAG